MSKKYIGSCGVVLIIFVVILGCIGGGLYWGYKKITSGMSSSRDLGVVYSVEDYNALMNSSGITVEDASKLCVGCPAPIYEKAVEKEVVISNAQASAWIGILNSELPVGSISNTQIRFKDGGAEVSTMFTYEGKTFPVYLSGGVTRTGNQSIDLSISDIKVGGLNIPSNLGSVVENGLEGIVNDKMVEMGDTFRIDTLKVTPSGLDFKGIYPTVIK